MAHYISFEPGIETNAIGPFLESSLGKQQRIEILRKNGIEMSEDLSVYYDLQSLLNAFKDLEAAVGDMNLFLIGKSVMEKAVFPPMEGLKDALQAIDIAYHMNHRKNGKMMFDPATGQMTEGIGHYLLTKYDETAREAEMVCDTPYPSKFEEGIVLQILRTFKPAGSIRTKVVLDETKETRRKGANSCTFKISW